MAIRVDHKRRLQLESLERRETPSALGAGVLAESVLHTRPIPFRGSGQVRVISETTRPDGSVQVHSSITGRGNPIGPFSGTVDTTLSPNHSSVTGTSLFTTASGSTIELNLSGSYGRPARITPFRGTFTIIHGTGPFAHATGGGTLNGNANVAQGTLSLRFNGRITE